MHRIPAQWQLQNPGGSTWSLLDPTFLFLSPGPETMLRRKEQSQVRIRQLFVGLRKH